jgi:hypothetical protein
MNEPPDPLEAELRAFRPLEVSPELRRGIAGRLASPPAKNNQRPWRRIALAGGLAASCLAALVLTRGGGRGADTGPAIVGSPTAPAPPGRTEDALPSLRAYKQALERSPEDLDALLDKHATHASGPDPQLVRIRAFNRPDLEALTFLGEL